MKISEEEKFYAKYLTSEAGEKVVEALTNIYKIIPEEALVTNMVRQTIFLGIYKGLINMTAGELQEALDKLNEETKKVEDCK